MNFGKKQSKQKTREPYGKVSEVGQVPIALQEIKELADPLKMEKGSMAGSVRLRTIRDLADSIITVTCANPGCLSEMAENATLKPIEQAFTCHGCSKEITINQDDPRHRVFEWADGKTSEKHPYCYDCDDILIQDEILPNAKKKMEVQS